MAMFYWNNTDQRIQVGVATQFFNHLYADGWDPLDANGSVIIGSGRFAVGDSYFVIARIMDADFELFRWERRVDTQEDVTKVAVTRSFAWFREGGYPRAGELGENKEIAEAIEHGDWEPYKKLFNAPDLKRYLCLWIRPTKTVNLEFLSGDIHSPREYVKLTMMLPNGVNGPHEYTLTGPFWKDDPNN